MIQRSESDLSLGDRLDRLVDMAAEKDSASFGELVRAAQLDPARDFVGACLRDQDFSDEDLRGFNFSDADLAYADFRGANVDGVEFDNAELTGVLGLKGVSISLYISYAFGNADTRMILAGGDAIKHFLKQISGKDVTAIFGNDKLYSQSNLATVIRRNGFFVAMIAPDYFSDPTCKGDLEYWRANGLSNRVATMSFIPRIERSERRPMINNLATIFRAIYVDKPSEANTYPNAFIDLSEATKGRRYDRILNGQAEMLAKGMVADLGL